VVDPRPPPLAKAIGRQARRWSRRSCPGSNDPGCRRKLSARSACHHRDAREGGGPAGAAVAACASSADPRRSHDRYGTADVRGAEADVALRYARPETATCGAAPRGWWLSAFMLRRRIWRRTVGLRGQRVFRARHGFSGNTPVEGEEIAKGRPRSSRSPDRKRIDQVDGWFVLRAAPAAVQRQPPRRHAPCAEGP